MLYNTDNRWLTLSGYSTQGHSGGCFVAQDDKPCSCLAWPDSCQCDLLYSKEPNHESQLQIYNIYDWNQMFYEISLIIFTPWPPWLSTVDSEIKVSSYDNSERLLKFFSVIPWLESVKVCSFVCFNCCQEFCIFCFGCLTSFHELICIMGESDVLIVVYYFFCGYLISQGFKGVLMILLYQFVTTLLTSKICVHLIFVSLKFCVWTLMMLFHAVFNPLVTYRCIQ